MITEQNKARLEEEKAALEGELLTIGRRNPENPNDWEALPQETGQESDPNDAADLISHYEDNTAILKDLEIRFNMVAAALERIEDGSYGTCIVCSAPIEEERLEADPAAMTCKAHMST